MFQWNVPFYCHSLFFIHSSVHGHLGCFHVRAIVNSAEMNIGVRVSFWIMIFSGCVPRSGIAGSYGSSTVSNGSCGRAGGMNGQNTAGRFMPVKLFYMTVVVATSHYTFVWTLRVYHTRSGPEYNCGFGVVIMYWHKFINGDKCTTLVGGCW